MVVPNRPLIKTWRMRIVFLIPKAINAQSEYVILKAFPTGTVVTQRVSVLRYCLYH
jgi:hypothetical protein